MISKIIIISINLNLIWLYTKYKVEIANNGLRFQKGRRKKWWKLYMKVKKRDRNKVKVEEEQSSVTFFLKLCPRKNGVLQRMVLHWILADFFSQT